MLPGRHLGRRTLTLASTNRANQDAVQQSRRISQVPGVSKQTWRANRGHTLRIELEALYDVQVGNLYEIHASQTGEAGE
jgi:hypothetical protein